MEKKVLNLLAKIRPEFDFSQSNNFIENGMLDSFDIVSLVDSLDTEFNISIDGTDIIAENFSTVENIIQLLIKNGITR